MVAVLYKCINNMVFVRKYFVIFFVLRNYNVRYVVGKILLAQALSVFLSGYVLTHFIHVQYMS